MRPTEDAERIAKVMRHPSIWPFVSDDFTPDNWQPHFDSGRAYLMPDDDTACFVFSQHSGYMVEGHLAVLPEGRHKGLEMAAEALDWVRDNTQAKACIGFIRADNEKARRYVERAGFVLKAIIPRGAAKDGRCMDVVFYLKEL